MAAKVTRTCVSIVYSVKVYDESNDSVFTKEISIDENDKPEKAIPAELPDNQTAIKFKAIKKVEELREMTSKDYVKYSRAVSRKETVLEQGKGEKLNSNQYEKGLAEMLAHHIEEHTP